MASNLNLSVELAFYRGLPQEYLSIFRVVFYTTVAPEPFMVVYFSVALSTQSPAPDVIRRSALECSDFPHIACSSIRDYPVGSFLLSHKIKEFYRFRLLSNSLLIIACCFNML